VKLKCEVTREGVSEKRHEQNQRVSRIMLELVCTAKHLFQLRFAEERNGTGSECTIDSSRVNPSSNGTVQEEPNCRKPECTACNSAINACHTTSTSNVTAQSSVVCRCSTFL
jgi:hypothetical protein